METVVRDESGKFICRFNEGCHCDEMNCAVCGFNPEVARRRLREFIRCGGLASNCKEVAHEL